MCLPAFEAIDVTGRRLRIDRYALFDSSWRATRNFLQCDWARLFEVSFEGEAGVDQGGLRREWFHLLTKFIFDPQNGLFVPIEEVQYFLYAI